MICWFYIEFLKKSVYCTSTFQRTSNEVIRWWAAAVAQFISTRRPKQTIKCRIFSRFFFQVENQSSYSTRWQWISYRRLVTKNRCQVTSCLINLDTRGSLIGHRTQRPSRRFVLLIYSVVSSDISPLLGFDMKIWTFFCPSNLAPIFPLHRPVRILISILCFTYSSVREMLAYHVILFLTILKQNQFNPSN